MVSTSSDGYPPVVFCRLSRDGRRLATGHRGLSFRVWDFATWRETLTLSFRTAIAFGDVSPDFRTLVVSVPNGQIQFWPLVEGAEAEVIQAHGYEPPAVAFSPDGRLLATGSADGTAKLWDAVTHRELAVLRGHLLGIHSLAFSPDGARLATASGGKEAVKLWDVATRQEVGTLAGEGSSYADVRFSTDGNAIGAMNAEGAVLLWRAPALADIEAGEPASTRLR